MRKRRDPVGLKELKSQLIVELGEVTPTSFKGVRNYWRGWRLLPDPPPGSETDDEDEDGDGLASADGLGGD
jgi:hypothetical protein